MKQILATAMIFSFFGLFSCIGKSADLRPDGFLESLNSSNDIRIIDVRTQPEYEEGHLQYAVNIDWDSANFIDKVRNTFDNKSSRLCILPYRTPQRCRSLCFEKSRIRGL